MPTLKKVLRLRTLAATSIGLGLASSVYTAVVQAGYAAGKNYLWVAILLAAGVCSLAARNFAELARRFPNAGGVQVYVRNAFGPQSSNTVSLMYIILAIAAGAAESYVFASVLRIIFQAFDLAILTALPLEVWIIVVLLAFLLINLIGVDIAGKVQEFMAFTLLLLLLGFSVYAFTGKPAQVTMPLGKFDTLMFTQAVAYAIYLFIGFEWITPLAEEAEDINYLGKAMSIAVLILGICYAVFGTAMLRYVNASAILNSTTPHMEFARVLAGKTGILIMGAVSIIATFTAFNAGIMGTSRLMYAMAREGVLPGFLAKIHLRFFTPWSSLVFIFALQLLLVLYVIKTGSFKTPIFLAATVECIIYTLVSLAVLKLRGWKKVIGPGLTALVFGVLTVLMVLPPTPPAVVILLAGGLIFALAYSVFIVPRLSR